MPTNSLDYFGDASYQALVYWIMAALTNDPFTLARFAGIYKAVQSAGAAGSFGMDAVATPYLNEHLASWIIMLISFPVSRRAWRLDTDRFRPVSSSRRGGSTVHEFERRAREGKLTELCSL